MFLRRGASEEESPGESPVNTKLLVGRNVKLNAWGLPGSYRAESPEAPNSTSDHMRKEIGVLFSILAGSAYLTLIKFFRRVSAALRHQANNLLINIADFRLIVFDLSVDCGG
jgi:hypothetical protein